MLSLRTASFDFKEWLYVVLREARKVLYSWDFVAVLCFQTLENKTITTIPLTKDIW